MHGYLYEMTTIVVEKEDWTSEANYSDCEFIEYMTLIDGEKRNKAIEHLSRYKWFNDMFVVGEEPDTIVFVGENKLKEYKDRWENYIQVQLNDMKNSIMFNTYYILHAIERGEFGDSILFCIPEYYGNFASKPNSFFEWICDMENGTVIYINSVFDYHY